MGDPVRIGNVLAFIVGGSSRGELVTPPNYGLHPLTGDRVGTWAMTVTPNWRLMFKINAQDALEDMDLEDYHGA